MVNKKKIPDFTRWTSKSRAALKPAWRKPRGINSKIRRVFGGKMKMPSVSYGANRDLRYVHPSGKMEVLVYTMKDLEKVNHDKQAVRIAAAVGKKKRMEIIKRSEEMKLKVLNPMRKSV
ncbi:MAG: 50S ribosomal protein L32e [Candidatus Aenigmarchaeota archaeon]|nr:50S ribosomal protein L32e [Candidatus Aenigmarchaeota archaeon]